MTTKSLSKEAALKDRKWHIVDATQIPVGRLASEVAQLIRGKHKPSFTPHVDCGDHVIVINASKVILTGKKAGQKKYYHHTGYIGGIKETPYKRLVENKPEQVIEKAVKGMLPRGALGHQMEKKLKVYSDDVHPHAAQKPAVYEMKFLNK